MTETAASSAVETRQGTAGEVFLVALRLGLTSFGGPIAHLGYYERTYVRQRQCCRRMSMPVSSPCARWCRARRAARSVI